MSSQVQAERSLGGAVPISGAAPTMEVNMAKAIKATKADKVIAATAKPAPKAAVKAVSKTAQRKAVTTPSPEVAKVAALKAQRKANPDQITASAFAKSGADVLVVKAGETTLTIPRKALTGELNKLAVRGGSLKAVQAWLATHKPTAKLANGITGRDAPHASKAVADNAAQTTKAAPTPKAGKAKMPSKGADYAYTKGNAFAGKAGTWTEYMVQLAQRNTGTAAAKAAHAKSGQYANKKLDFTWMLAKGFIVASK